MQRNHFANPRITIGRSKYRWVIGILFLSCIFSLLIHFQPMIFIVTLLSAVNLFFCGIVELRHLAAGSVLVNRLCRMEAGSNPGEQQNAGTAAVNGCDMVLDRGRLPGNITIGDIGLMYFGSQFLYGWITSAVTPGIPDITLMAIAGWVAWASTVGLLVYQGFVIRRWCRICLMITAILWVQAGCWVCWLVLFGRHAITLAAIRLPELSLLLTCIGLSLSWLMIKPLMTNSAEVNRMRVQLLKWKRDPALFSSLLSRQHQAISRESLGHDLRFGNPDAPWQLTAVINPYCNRCAIDFLRIYSLLKQQPDNFGVSLRIMHQSQLLHQQTARILLGACLDEPVANIRLKMLKDWFAKPQLRTWARKWRVTTNYLEDTRAILHQDWGNRNGIRFTPSIFVNGAPLPEPYQLKDLSMIQSPAHAIS